MNRLIIFVATMLATASIANAQKTVVELNEDQLKPIRQQIINQHE